MPGGAACVLVGFRASGPSYHARPWRAPSGRERRFLIICRWSALRYLRLLVLAIFAVTAWYAGSARTARDYVVSHLLRARSVAYCSRIAAPWGSDTRGRGTVAHPYRSLTRLDESLRPGQVGCLRGGTYGGLDAWHLLDRSGSSGAPVTITGYPRETATVKGWIDVEASNTTVQNIRIDGSNTRRPGRIGSSCQENVSQPLTISGHDDILQRVDYFQSVASLRSTGIGIGFWGNTDGTIVRHNKIHDVGGCDFYDHLIYLAGGRNVQIYDNWLWDDAHGWGIKLDPGPSGARIWNNVIDRAGSGFNFGNSSGDQPTANNRVFDNVVMNSVGISNPDIHWHHPGVLVTSPGLLPSSVRNYVWNNDSYRNRGGMTSIARGVRRTQLSVSDNHRGVPQFRNAAIHDYSVVATAARRKH